MSARVAPAVRAVFGACTAPEGTVHFRVDFPAAAPDIARDPATGIVGPDPTRLPLPVVVLHGNFNCEPHLYSWLARALALAGFAVVRFTWVVPLFGGRPGLSTGIDLSAVTPEQLGERSPHAILDHVLAAAAALPDLDAALDLDHVVLGGHSAGGTLALLAASPRWHRGVCGAFSYGGHTRAQTGQGFGTDHYLPVPGGVPLLLLGGTADGVVGAIARLQGHQDPVHPMQATHDRAVPAGTPAELVLIEGADHYAFAEGYDGSTGRGYLEVPGPAAPDEVRRRLEPLIVGFCRSCVNAS